MSRTAQMWEAIIGEIEDRRVKAQTKHGIRTVETVAFSNAERFIVLMEEIGEVARALTYDEADDDKVLDELMDVATVAVMWVYGARKRMPHTRPPS